MTTPTETAILAVVAALQAEADSTAAVLPGPLRNEDLLARLTDATGDLKLHLNVLDGDRGDADEMLGADLSDEKRYDLSQRVEIEWMVAGGDSAAREARFDAGRKAIWDALKPDTSGGSITYLGGAVSGIRLVDLISHSGTNAAGAPNIKACVFVFELTFASSDPF